MGVNVYVGSSSIHSAVKYDVDEVTIHPSFTASAGLKYDLAMIRMKRPMTFNKDVQKICLCQSATRANSRCYVTGVSLEPRKLPKQTQDENS